MSNSKVFKFKNIRKAFDKAHKMGESGKTITIYFDSDADQYEVKEATGLMYVLRNYIVHFDRDRDR